MKILRTFDTVTDAAIVAIGVVSILGLCIVVIATSGPSHISDEIWGGIDHIEVGQSGSFLVGQMKASQMGVLADNGSFMSVKDDNHSQFNARVLSMAPAGASSILLTGEFTSYGQSLVGHIAKLDTNGELDRDFLRNMGTGFDGNVRLVHPLSNGDFVVAGDFRSYNGTDVDGLAYLYSDGRVKVDFAPSQGLNGRVLSISGDVSSKLVLAGEFTQWAGKDQPYILEY